MIYINARFLSQNLTGVQRFAEEISLSLKKIRHDITFVAPKDIIRADIAEKLNVQVIGYLKGHLWEQIELPAFLRKNGSPLLLNLCSTAPILYHNQIVTHHDVTYKRYPESYSKKFRFFYNSMVPLMIKNSHCLITVSEFSKNDISVAYSIQPEKIIVVPNAVSSDFLNLSEKEILFDRDYLLAVSSQAYHKNFHKLIEAFNGIQESNIKLKVVGGMSTGFSSQSFIESINNKNIEFLGRISDYELVNLYRGAIGFVFPSLYEGFGIPPLEAQSCECPVLSSNTASMPEVLGDSVIYFSPDSVVEIRQSIVRLINDEKLRKELIKKGLINAKRFSWDESAQRVDELINKILN
ncbi:glycosyltransferase family 4 protein [Pectobacterium colocasium]|uniref:glycosyltransferase family 4 protein n=1 Tax=Pectobacterium TaxID=122277 RepID=UPI003D722AD8